MTTIVGMAVLLLLPLGFLWGLRVAVRHGPFQHRGWQGETVPGFALTVGGLAFAVGFVGPMVVTPDANQGPLLGLLITGPIGLLVGVLWGLVRARRRAR